MNIAQASIPKIGEHRGVIIITGASTGIGYASTLRLVQSGYFVFGSVRRVEDAERLESSLQTYDSTHRGGFAPLFMDICDSDEVKMSAEYVAKCLKDNGIHTLTALVNNAGIALGGPLLEIELDLLRRQIEVNLIGQLSVIQAFAPLLGTRSDSLSSSEHSQRSKRGRIIQVSSISGVRAMPFVGPYTASKFALEGLSDSLRMELYPYGVDVIIVQPGPISTEIWDKAPTPQDHPYQNSPYQRALEKFYEFVVEGGKRGLPPSSIAAVIQRAIEAKKPKARYVKTPGFIKRYLLPRWLPTRVFDRLIAKMLALDPQHFHQSSTQKVEERD